MAQAKENEKAARNLEAKTAKESPDEQEEETAEQFDNKCFPDDDDHWEVNQVACGFAQALLQNPNIERYLKRPPLEEGLVQDNLNQGQYLARGCKKMAQDFLAELEIMDAE